MALTAAARMDSARTEAIAAALARVRAIAGDRTHLPDDALAGVDLDVKSLKNLTPAQPHKLFHL
jgi:hypothetical protein